MTTLLEDLRSRLVAAGIGPVIVGRRPPDTGTVVVIQVFPGGPSRVLNDTNLPAVENLAAQITVRVDDTSQRAAEVLARQAHDAIVGRHLVINGNHYDSITADHLPAPIGVDEQARTLVVTNLTIRRRGFQATVAA